ncbi:hypothetical protein LUZ60_004227 [Juncus effusus]|nr:hypothetical protein LUZ60_004227 [Juncus effusus]
MSDSNNANSNEQISEPMPIDPPEDQTVEVPTAEETGEDPTVELQPQTQIPLQENQEPNQEPQEQEQEPQSDPIPLPMDTSSEPHPDPQPSTPPQPTDKKDEPSTPIHISNPLEISISTPTDESELSSQVVKSEEEAHRLYCEYGHKTGFSVRKGKQYYYVGTKNICTKDYYCSKEGSKDTDKLTEQDFKDPHTRTNCKAMVRFRVDEEGNWRVVHLVKEHNHPLVKPEERHLLRSARSHTAGRQRLIDLMTSPFFQSINNYASSSVQGGSLLSQQEVRSIVKPVYISGADSQSLVNLLKTKGLEDGMFYWDVQVDSEGRFGNFFWRDGRSRVDYDTFGDVVVFDTSFRLNKYNLICCPFVGVNHHWQNVMFGCGLLIDEKTESFWWLFKSFLDSMGGNYPKSIFTDQNLSMARAIEQVFPNTRHRIYQRFIHKNLMPRLGSLNLNDSKSFHKMFNKCLHGCNSEQELELTWSTMLKEFKLQDHKWLNNLYKIRNKWCSALNKDAFDGGIEWDQRTESMSNIFDGIADKSGNLGKFFFSAEKLTEDWREKEYEEDIHLNQKAIVCAIKYSEILNHASKIYTHKIYKLFELEYLEGCGATFFKEVPQGGTIYKFECTNQSRGSTTFTVTLDINTLQISCDCQKFVTMGILCSHSLKALTVKNIGIIPERNIVKRWSKSARKRVYYDKNGEYFSKVMRYCYDLVLKSQGHKELRDLVWQAVEGGEESLEKFGEITNLHTHSFATR